MKCPMIKKCGGCFYPQNQYQEELKEKTLFIEKEIKKAKLKIEYALFWIVSSILLLILSIFPQIAYFFADICGIKSPVNFIFLFSIMVLFVHNFYLTLRISNLDNMINSLTEEIAVRDYYKKEEENESK